MSWCRDVCVGYQQSDCFGVSFAYEADKALLILRPQSCPFSSSGRGGATKIEMSIMCTEVGLALYTSRGAYRVPSLSQSIMAVEAAGGILCTHGTDTVCQTATLMVESCRVPLFASTGDL
jgi:hypothetical protein